MQNSPQDLRKKILGRQGEELTCKYLKQHGYKIIERNYRTPFGEADVIALQGDTYCFVEVKTRINDAYGLPAEAVNKSKQRRYRQMAGFFCAERKEEVSVRFDVAAIYEGKLEYFEGAYI